MQEPLVTHQCFASLDKSDFQLLFRINPQQNTCLDRSYVAKTKIDSLISFLSRDFIGQIDSIRLKTHCYVCIVNNEYDNGKEKMQKAISAIL